MATPNYPSIPDPTATLEGLRDSVLAIKQVLEILTGQRGSGGAAVITNDTLPPPPEIPPAFPPTGGTLTGDVIIDKDEPRLIVDKNASGQYAAVQGNMAGNQRWFMALGDSDAETGGNSGSNFSLHRYDDAGAWIGVPMTINRANGRVTFPGQLIVTSGGITAHGWGGDNNQGVLFLNAAQNRYLHWDGTKYYFNAAPMEINGSLTLSGGGILSIPAGQIRLSGYSGNTNASVIYLNAALDRYLHYDGANYILANAHLYNAAGRVWGTNDGTPLWTAGGTMSGRITFNARPSGDHCIVIPGSDLIGIAGPMNTIYLQGATHAGMTFLINGVWGGNFGMANDGNFYCGGWSFGTGTYYQFHTTRNFNKDAVIINARLVYVGDYDHVANPALIEPWSAVVTGAAATLSRITVLRYRQLQLQNNAGSWFTVGFA